MFIYHSLFALLGRPIVGIWICANINRCVSREEVASYYVLRYDGGFSIIIKL